MKINVRPAGPVPQAALDYFRAKSLAPEIDMVQAWGEEHDYAFAVASVAAEDLLAAMRQAVDRALAEGITFQEFARELDSVVEALGWKGSNGKPPWRLRIIYDTNLRVARSAGQWTRIQRTKDARPYLRYELGPSERHRPLHETWEGTVLPVDHSWWGTHMTPNGFGCRCRVRQLSTAEAERYGVADEPPAGAPDPGWERNPGASRGP